LFRVSDACLGPQALGPLRAWGSCLCGAREPPTMLGSQSAHQNEARRMAANFAKLLGLRRRKETESFPEEPRTQ